MRFYVDTDELRDFGRTLRGIAGSIGDVNLGLAGEFMRTHAPPFELDGQRLQFQLLSGQMAFLCQQLWADSLRLELEARTAEALEQGDGLGIGQQLVVGGYSTAAGILGGAQRSIAWGVDAIVFSNQVMREIPGSLEHVIAEDDELKVHPNLLFLTRLSKNTIDIASELAGAPVGPVGTIELAHSQLRALGADVLHGPRSGAAREAHLAAGRDAADFVLKAKTGGMVWSTSRVAGAYLDWYFGTNSYENITPTRALENTFKLFKPERVE